MLRMIVARDRGRSAVLAACMVLTGCGGGGGGGTESAQSESAVKTEAVSATKLMTDGDAARLAKQATFGPTQAVVDRIQQLGLDGWLNEQFAATGSSYADIVADKILVDACGGDDGRCYRRHFTREPIAMRFYQDALQQPDQLRQRVAFALSQVLVTSALTAQSSSGLGAFNQILLDNAFGNYATILTAVTKSAYMGTYLDSVNSSRQAPSENYAREMLQLFSMGPDKLNMDGTPVLDYTGARVANYGPADIRGIARALTGWTYAHFKGLSSYLDWDYAAPMVAAPLFYDTGAKTFLGKTLAAGTSQADAINAVVAMAFWNASTPPFISKALIKHLVTSNPSPAYVGRVAAVFANNGSNVRGDMRAVIRAILIDPEARGDGGTGDTYGKVKEPVLLLTQLSRVTNMTTDGTVFLDYDTAMGQPVFNSGSVFNFYPLDFPLPKSSTLMSPASKLLSAGTVVPRANFAFDWTIAAATPLGQFQPNQGIANTTGSAQDWSSWEAFGTDTDGMIARIDLLLLNRTMTTAQKAALKAAANAITVTVTHGATPIPQARLRAQAMLYVVASSPLFQVDR